MFEWLVDEMTRIKTRKFLLVDGPASAELRQAVESSSFPLPPSYKEFALRFGNAKLYRRDSYYYVTVFAGPREAESSKGEAFIQFGRTWTSMAYFKESLLAEGKESAVFEWHHENGIKKTADGFEEWLKEKCKAARKRYRKKEWEAIEHGPPPFTERELAVVEARKHFRWRVVGIAPNGNLQFEVHNGSSMILPYLTVGIRHKGGEAFGGVKLPVSGIRPGQTAVVEVDCYKKTHDPHKIEAFQEPDSEPALRDLYWEFKGVK